MNIQINQERLAQITTLKAGSHNNFSNGVCAMEAVAYISGEELSDTPKCACPVISAFMRNWNDSLPDRDRTRLILPYVHRLVGTKSSAAIEQRRAAMAADWLIRVHTPVWLRLAGMTSHADALEQMPEITDFAKCPALMPALKAAQQDSAAAGAAAWAAARDAAGTAALAAALAAARDAAWAATGDAAWAAARDAAWDAARDAAGAAALAATRDAAWAAARDAAWDATGDAAWAAAWAATGDAARAAAWAATGAAAWAAARAALKPAVEKLQASVLTLIDHMIDARTA